MPRLVDREAWAYPATQADVKHAVAFLVTVVDPALAENPDRFRTLTALVAGRGYTRAELLLAMKRLPFENAYGEGFRLDLVESLVTESRKVRAIVGNNPDGKPRLLTQRQMFDICAEFPEELSPDRFGIADYDADHRPLYRFATDGTRHVHEPYVQEVEPPAPVRQLAEGEAREPITFSAAAEAVPVSRPAPDAAEDGKAA